MEFLPPRMGITAQSTAEIPRRKKPGDRLGIGFGKWSVSHKILRAVQKHQHPD